MAKSNFRSEAGRKAKKIRARLTDHEIALIAELHEKYNGDYRKVAARIEALLC